MMKRPHCDFQGITRLERTVSGSMTPLSRRHPVADEDQCDAMTTSERPSEDSLRPSGQNHGETVPVASEPSASASPLRLEIIRSKLLRGEYLTRKAAESTAAKMLKRSALD